MKVVVMMGIPGSGKTTWIAENLDYEEFPNVICPDDIRERLTGDASDQSRNPEVFEIAHARLKWLLLHGENVVWDATNVTERARDSILEVCKEFGAETELYIMCVPYEVCFERNAARDRVVPEHAMERMTKQFLDSFNHLDTNKWGNVEYLNAA